MQRDDSMATMQAVWRFKSMAKMEFGYHPPSGDRGIEIIREREYQSDFKKAMDVAAQSFKSVWISDHLAYADEFRLECWTHLTWVAAQYPNVDLGTIVMCNSWRQPSLMAKMAASLHWISNGRLILGYGAGWHEGEYKSYGFDFPRPGVRVEMADEGVQIMKAMWGPGPVTFEGKYYKVENAYCEPRFEKPPILLLGMSGELRAMRVVAKYADWWNIGARPVDDLRQKLAVLKGHCDAVGREFSTLRKTLNVRVYIAKTQKEAQEMVERRSRPGSHPIAGDPVSVREQLAELAELGFDYSILTFVNFQELDDLKLFIDKVMPDFA
jgi:alkanesulfonate monooxygenase SsuD/methylene tetrahydromethanopterin reductase-like flavin-dependent oxidoreductase (luciferase family)